MDLPTDDHIQVVPGSIQEGWLLKRGEYIKNWRPRYFILRDDGTFYGYKTKPRPGSLSDPCNEYNVKGCQVSQTSEVNKSNAFTIQTFQMTTLVKRMYSVESPADRAMWIYAIQKVIKEDPAAARPISSKSATMSLDSFTMLKVLGKGTFGKVMCCREKSTGEIYAMKLLKTDVIIADSEAWQSLVDPVTCDHPFIVQLKYSFRTTDRLCFVMQYVNGGELFFHLSRERVFSEDRSRFYAAEITSALGYLHGYNIVYRDLKLENLLLDAEGHIKLTDFGLCQTEISLTPEYLAPEVLEDNDYSRAVDWWGLGVVLYEMICGRLPFYNRENDVLFELILTEDVKYPARVSDTAKNILNQLLMKDPSRRLGGSVRDVEEVCKHDFFETINMDDIYNKRMKPPFKPEIKSENDWSTFESEVDDPVRLTPPSSPLPDNDVSVFDPYPSLSYVKQ